MPKRILLLFGIICIFKSVSGQVNLGIQYSTFNLPAPKFRTGGLGITGEFDAAEKTVYGMTVAFYKKKNAIDSFSELPPGGGDPVYTSFRDQYSFIHVSAYFLRYLAGSTSYDSRFSLYAGGGLSYLHRQLKTDYYTNPTQTVNDPLNTMGFEFILGSDVKIVFAKLFLRGKFNILLQHPIPYTDETAAPLLTDLQLGILIPLKKE